MEQTRRQLANLAKKKVKEIDKLKNDLNLILIKSYQLNDKKQQYKEKLETFGRGKKKRTIMIGRIHYKQKFKDEDTGKYFTIERSQIVREDGVWILWFNFESDGK